MSIAVGFYTCKDLNDFLNLPLYVKYYELDVHLTLELFSKDYDEKVIREILINPKMKEYIYPLFTGVIYKRQNKAQIIILQEHLNGNLELKFDGGVLEECIKIFNSKETSNETREVITDYIANCINSGKYINEYYVNPILYILSFGPKTKALVTNLLSKLDNPTQYLYDENGKPIEILKPFYKPAITKELIDTSLGFRGSGLPSLAIENIASHAYDTSGMQLHEIMNIVANINERPKPGVVQSTPKVSRSVPLDGGATADTFDEQEFIDV